MRLSYLVLLVAAVLLNRCGDLAKRGGTSVAPASHPEAVRVITGRDSLLHSDSLAPGTANTWANFVAFSNVSRAHHMPRFNDFVVEAYPGEKPSPVDLASAPGARKFRTVLRMGARKGPNFADHFTVVKWGCGSPCVQIAVIDARTGHVYMPGQSFITAPMYRRDSRLLVVDPTGFVTDTLGHPIFPLVEYFEWNGDKLIRVDSLDASELRLPLDRMAWTCRQCTPIR